MQSEFPGATSREGRAGPRKSRRRKRGGSSSALVYRRRARFASRLRFTKSKAPAGAPRTRLPTISPICAATATTRRRQLPLALLGEPRRRRGDPDRSDYRPVAVANRRGDAAHSIQVLRFVRGEALLADASALRGQRPDALRWCSWCTPSAAWRRTDPSGPAPRNRSSSALPCDVQYSGTSSPVCPEMEITWLLVTWSMNSAFLPSRTARWAVSLVSAASALSGSCATRTSILLQSYWRESRQTEGPSTIVPAGTGIGEKAAPLQRIRQAERAAAVDARASPPTGPEKRAPATCPPPPRISRPRSRLWIEGVSRVSLLRFWSFFTVVTGIPSPDYSMPARASEIRASITPLATSHATDSRTASSDRYRGR